MLEKLRGAIWFGIAFAYFSAQCLLYAQDRAAQQQQWPSTPTPWEHLSLESALAIAVGVQYRENRAKEAAATKMATDAAAAIQKATSIMEQVTAAMERLASKVDQCPVRIEEDLRRPPKR